MPDKKYAFPNGSSYMDDSSSSVSDRSPQQGPSGLVWSATPTPLRDDLTVDQLSVQRLVEHHAALGVDGIFLAGTCGEGPWLDTRQTMELLRGACDTNRGSIQIGVQVTENSPARVLERMELLEAFPYDVAIVAQPGIFMNATPARVMGYYLEILERSPKPICFYDRGSRPDFPLDTDHLSEIYAHPRISIIKDSSSSPKRREVALLARSKRPGLKLLNGDEFRCMEYLEADYDGFMTGGAILSGFLLRRQMEAYRHGRPREASEIDARVQRLLRAVYGGESISCWLTGLKHSLVELGIFSSSASILGYPLTAACREETARVIRDDYEWLLPGRNAAAVAGLQPLSRN